MMCKCEQTVEVKTAVWQSPSSLLSALSHVVVTAYDFVSAASTAASAVM